MKDHAFWNRLAWGAASIATALALAAIAACRSVPPQKGGGATTTLTRPGGSNVATLAQSENPKEPSRQTVQSEQVLEYVLPPGSIVALGQPQGGSAWQPQTNSGAASANRSFGTLGTRASWGGAAAILSKATAIKCTTKDRTETSIGGAQKDTVREWAGKAANLQPVMWAGIAMMTVVAGALIYFGWWTKAAMAVVVGIGMVVLAHALPEHGAAILLGGVGVFGLCALLVLYAYHKGKLDQGPGQPAALFEKDRETSG